VTADDLGVALVAWPVELGDEIAVDGHPWQLEVVDVVWASPGARVAAIVKVRAARAAPGLPVERDPSRAGSIRASGRRSRPDRRRLVSHRQLVSPLTRLDC
jgi:hypothetical protein